MSVRDVIAKLFFEGQRGKTSGALGKLQRVGKIQIRENGLPQGYSYYQLTPKACVDLGVPVNRAESLSGLQLARFLGALWFATMKGARRALFEGDTLPAHYPPVPPALLHVGEVLPNGTGRIHRLHVTAEDKDYLYPFSEIRKVVRRMQETPETSAFLSSGHYGFAVLVHEDAKRARFEKALSTYGPKFFPGVVVTVETVPSPGNFPSFVRSEP